MENVRESHATHESNFTGIFGFSVHTIPDSWRIQKFPFWRADSKSCGFVCRIHRIRVDDSKPKPERKNSGLKNILIRVDGAWITHKPHSNPFEEGLILDTSTFESVVFTMVYLDLLVCLLNYKSFFVDLIYLVTSINIYANWTRVSRIFSLFQFCIGWGRENYMKISKRMHRFIVACV